MPIPSLLGFFLQEQADFAVFGLFNIRQDVVSSKRFAIIAHAAQIIMRIATAFVIKQPKRFGTKRRVARIDYKYRLVWLGFLKLLQRLRISAVLQAVEFDFGNQRRQVIYRQLLPQFVVHASSLNKAEIKQCTVKRDSA